MFSRRSILSVIVLSSLANVLVVFAPWPYVGAIGIYLLLVPLPGLLLAGLLLRHRRPPWMDHLLYGFGAGYGCAVMLMLALSYLPNGLSGWTILLAADLLIGVLAMIGWQVRWRSPTDGRIPHGPDRVWAWAGAITLLASAAFLRLTNLGYSEFQGDEARAALRAAAVIQGYEDVLFLHRKGPAEILLPTVPFAVLGRLDEVVARLPFAIANMVGLFALFRLGTRLHSPLAGWISAALFVVDGYFVGLARIVQYQSVVLLTTVLVVLLFYDLYRSPRDGIGALILAAWLLATGMFAHYEAILAVIPASVLLGATAWQAKAARRTLLTGIGLAVLVGAAMLAVFYVPFVRHPNFADTFAYLTGERIGTALPYNNVPLFVRQTMIYSSAYYLILLTSVTMAGLVAAYWRGFGRPVAMLMTLAVVALFVILLLQHDMLMIGNRDWMIVPVASALIVVWFLPNLRFEERLLWIWFGAVFILALFLIEKPNTHVYTFLLPWLLLVGMLLATAWTAVRDRIGVTGAVYGGVAVALSLLILFGNYAYWLFVHNGIEVLQQWPRANPAGYWMPIDRLGSHASFGAPHAVGWKTIGALYADGTLSGAYDTSEDAWVPAWYTLGQERCQRNAVWYFEAEDRALDEGPARKAMERVLDRGFEKWGLVEVNDVVRMRIYRRTGSKIDQPHKAAEDNLPHFQADVYGRDFDIEADTALPLAHPIVGEQIAQPLHINLDNRVWLEGYRLEYEEPLRPNDSVRLTLYWRGQQSMKRSYRVFNQSYYGEGKMIAHADGFPVCDSYETWRWTPGELIVDRYEIHVRESAPPGVYPLITGMYDPESGERLTILDDRGQAAGTEIHLADIVVAGDE